MKFTLYLISFVSYFMSPGGEAVQLSVGPRGTGGPCDGDLLAFMREEDDDNCAQKLPSRTCVVKPLFQTI